MRNIRDIILDFFNSYKKYMVLAMFLFMCVIFYNGTYEGEGQVVAQGNDELNGMCTNEMVTADKITLNGEFIGFCEGVDAEQLKTKVLTALNEKLGYEYEGEFNLLIEKGVELDGLVLGDSYLESKVLDLAYSSIDRFKKEAYVVKIGEDFVVALEDEADVKAALDYAKSKYVNVPEEEADVDLVKDDRNSLVISPVLKLSKVVKEKNLLTSSQNGTDSEINDKIKEKKLVDAHFETPIIAVNSYVYIDEIKTLDEAKTLITKENEKEKTYVVQKGDYPELIAEKNGMQAKTLYELNPGLRERQDKIQIGETLVVMVPEPEVSVATTELIVYEEPVEFEVEYEENPDAFVGDKKVKFEGEVGTKKVSANVNKVNGNEISREIVAEEIVKEPKAKIIVKGTKPLPAKGATGKFACPLKGYVITSRFGRRGRGFHKGIDLAAPVGRTVYAADGGTVTFAAYKRSFGNLVIIDHGDGTSTFYAHNSKLLVSEGAYVSKGQPISKVGSTGRSTGPHLHFEIRVNGNSVNPARYINF